LTRRFEERFEETRQMGEMTHYGDLTSVASKSIAHLPRRIVRLKIPNRRELSQRVRRTPDGLRGLAGSKLAAVPDDSRSHATTRHLEG
jgi:hypothetical protein